MSDDDSRLPLAEAVDLEPLVAFLLEIDALKHCERRSYVTGAERRENSAEHSWHVVMGAWTLARQARVPLSMERLLKMAAVHDLCELDHGDTFIHTADAAEQRRLEEICVGRLMSEHGEVFDELEQLWLEYEEGATPEARFVAPPIVYYRSCTTGRVGARAGASMASPARRCCGCMCRLRPISPSS